MPNDTKGIEQGGNTGQTFGSPSVNCYPTVPKLLAGLEFGSNRGTAFGTCPKPDEGREEKALPPGILTRALLPRERAAALRRPFRFIRIAS